MTGFRVLKRTRKIDQETVDRFRRPFYVGDIAADTRLAENEKRSAQSFGKLRCRYAVDVKPAFSLSKKTFDFPSLRHLDSLYLSLT